MLGFLCIVFTLLILDVYWAARAWRYAGHLSSARIWRSAVLVFAAVQISVLFLTLVLRTVVVKLEFHIPTLVMATIYIWHILVLPAATLPSMAIQVFSIWRARRSRAHRTLPSSIAAEAPSTPEEGSLSRRQVLAAVAIAAPPLVAGGLVGYALRQRNEFRVNHLTVSVPNLPPNLDGLRIAHLSDTHVGAFTHGPMLQTVAEATNKLKADLVCFTGDLIDFSLADLPEGLDFLARLDPRAGLALCVGNHDLFADGNEFRRRVIAKGYSLLVDRPNYYSVRGEVIQILGLDWGLPTNYRPHMVPLHMERLAPKVKRDQAFPILLAHHPHAFDPAAAAGIPLVLSGHTHGGQLNLTKNIGGGAMMFKYWSGLYSKPNSRLVVSNGIGNWFPLRVNAPAEIVHLTLRREM